MRVLQRTWRRADGTIATSRYWSIAFQHNGVERVEATKATTQTAAWKLLRQRVEGIGRGEYTPNQDTVTLAQLVEQLRANYQHNNRRSIKYGIWKLKPVLEFLGEHRKATHVTIKHINDYIAWRLDQGKARATVNNELRYLRRLYYVGRGNGVLQYAPVIKLLEGVNTRDGFIEYGDFQQLLTHFRDTDVRDLVEWLYHTGWRVNAGMGLEWKSVNGNTVTMTSALSKNKEPLQLPMTPTLLAIMERRRALRQLSCPYVFHRNGRQIKYFRGEWKWVAAAARFPKLLVHDTCRSMAINLSRGGVPETVASKFMNRKTVAIYKQYRIVASNDLADAGQMLETYLSTNTEPKVREIK